MEALAVAVCPKCDINLSHDLDEDNWFCPECFEDYTLIDDELAPID